MPICDQYYKLNTATSLKETYPFGHKNLLENNRDTLNAKFKRINPASEKLLSSSTSDNNGKQQQKQQEQQRPQKRTAMSSSKHHSFSRVATRSPTPTLLSQLAFDKYQVEDIKKCLYRNEFIKKNTFRAMEEASNNYKYGGLKPEYSFSFNRQHSKASDTTKHSIHSNNEMNYLRKAISKGSVASMERDTEGDSRDKTHLLINQMTRLFQRPHALVGKTLETDLKHLAVQKLNSYELSDELDHNEDRDHRMFKSFTTFGSTGGFQEIDETTQNMLLEKNSSSSLVLKSTDFFSASLTVMPDIIQHIYGFNIKDVTGYFEFFLEIERRYEEYLVSLRNSDLRNLRSSTWAEPHYFRGFETEEGFQYYGFKPPQNTRYSTTLSNFVALEWGCPLMNDQEWGLLAYETLLIIYHHISDQIAKRKDSQYLDFLASCSVNHYLMEFEGRRLYHDVVMKPHSSAPEPFQWLSEVVNNLKDILTLMRIRLGLGGEQNSLLLKLICTSSTGQWTCLHPLDVRSRVVNLADAWILTEISNNQDDTTEKQNLRKNEFFRRWVIRQLHFIYIMVLFKVWRLLKFFPDGSLQQHILEKLHTFNDSTEVSWIRRLGLPRYPQRIDDSFSGHLNSLSEFLELACTILHELSLSLLNNEWGVCQMTTVDASSMSKTKTTQTKGEAPTEFTSFRSLEGIQRLLIVMTFISTLDHCVRIELAKNENILNKKPERVSSKGKLMTPHHHRLINSSKGLSEELSNVLRLSIQRVSSISSTSLMSGRNTECFEPLDLAWAYEPAIAEFLLMFFWKQIADPQKIDGLHTNAGYYAEAILVAALVMQVGYDLTDKSHKFRVTTISFQTHCILAAQALWESVTKDSQQVQSEVTSPVVTPISAEALDVILDVITIKNPLEWLSRLTKNESSTSRNLRLTAQQTRLAENAPRKDSVSVHAKPQPKLWDHDDGTLRSLLKLLVKRPWDSLWKYRFFSRSLDAAPFYTPLSLVQFWDALDPDFSLIDVSLLVSSEQTEISNYLQVAREKRLDMFTYYFLHYNSPKKNVTPEILSSFIPRSKTAEKYSHQQAFQLTLKPNDLKKQFLLLEKLEGIREEVEGVSLTLPSRVERVMSEVLFTRMLSFKFRTSLFQVLCDYRYKLDIDGLPHALRIWELLYDLMFHDISSSHTAPIDPDLTQYSIRLPMTCILTGPSYTQDMYRYFIFQSISSVASRIFSPAHDALELVTTSESKNKLPSDSRPFNEKSQDVIIKFFSALTSFVEELRGELLFYNEIWEPLLPCQQHALIAVYSSRVNIEQNVTKLVNSSFWPPDDIPNGAASILSGIATFERLVREVSIAKNLDVPVYPDILHSLEPSVTACVIKRFDIFELSFKRSTRKESWEPSEGNGYSTTVADLISVFHHFLDAIIELQVPVTWVVPSLLEILGRITQHYADSVFSRLPKDNPLMQLKEFSDLSIMTLLDPPSRSDPRGKQLNLEESNFDSKERHRHRSLSKATRIGGRLLKKVGKFAEKNLHFNQANDEETSSSEQLSHQISVADSSDDSMTNQNDKDLNKCKPKKKKNSKREPSVSETRFGLQLTICYNNLNKYFEKQPPLKTLLVRLHNLNFFNNQLPKLTKRFFTLTREIIKSRDPLHTKLFAALSQTKTRQPTLYASETPFLVENDLAAINRLEIVVQKSVTSCQNLLANRSRELMSYISLRLVYYECGEDFFEQLYYPELSEFQLTNIIQAYNDTIERFITNVPKIYQQMLKQFIAHDTAKCWMLLTAELRYRGAVFNDKDYEILKEDLGALKKLFDYFNVLPTASLKAPYSEQKTVINLINHIEKFITSMSKEENLRSKVENNIEAAGIKSSDGESLDIENAENVYPSISRNIFKNNIIDESHQNASTHFRIKQLTDQKILRTTIHNKKKALSKILKF